VTLTVDDLFNMPCKPPNELEDGSASHEKNLRGSMTKKPTSKRTAVDHSGGLFTRFCLFLRSIGWDVNIYEPL